MNRYVADGILDDVMSGKTVLLVSEGGPAVVAALETFASRVERRCLAGVTIRRGHGDQGVAHSSGGRVVCVTARGTGGRGVSADVLFVDADLTAGRYAELMPCVVASPHAETMRR